MQERSPRTCAALAAQAGDPLRLSNDERSHLARILHVLSRLKTAAATRLARRADLFRSPGFETAATIATALLEHLGRDHSFVATLRQERRGLPPTRLDPPRLLDGTDIARLRIPKGPLYGQLLREVHDLTVEGTLCTRTQALRWLRKRTTGIRTQEPES
jgi:hypothetical protein